jgi:uncharacterized damage-inducible protein DinB
MPILTEMAREFDQEMGPTRRVLERVPTEKAEWKPHPKSFPLGHLAQLVSWMPGWLTNALRETELNLSGVSGYSFEPTEKLLEGFDKNVREAQEAFKTAKDSDLGVMWALKRGDTVLFGGPRGMILRNHLSHLIHHRAQLGVYLRLIDVPVPSMYGPTADERMPGLSP